LLNRSYRKNQSVSFVKQNDTGKKGNSFIFIFIFLWIWRWKTHSPKFLQLFSKFPKRNSKVASQIRRFPWRRTRRILLSCYILKKKSISAIQIIIHQKVSLTIGKRSYLEMSSPLAPNYTKNVGHKLKVDVPIGVSKWAESDRPALRPDKKTRAGSRNSTRQPHTARPAKSAGPTGQPVGQNGPARGPYQLIKNIPRAYCISASLSLPHSLSLCLCAPHPPTQSLPPPTLSLRFPLSLLRSLRRRWPPPNTPATPHSLSLCLRSPPTHPISPSAHSLSLRFLLSALATSSLATAKHTGHHVVVANHTRFSSPPPWHPPRRWLFGENNVHDHRENSGANVGLRLADDSDRHDHRQDKYVPNLSCGSISPDL